MAEEIQTVKVKSGDTECGYMLINQDQFDPATMELWYEPGTEPAVEEAPAMVPADMPESPPPSEPSGDVLEAGRRGRRAP